MAARPNRKKAPLTDYQRSQVEQIAAWKSLPPDPLTELWSIIARPLARLVGALTPDRLVEIAIEKADDLAATCRRARRHQAPHGRGFARRVEAAFARRL